MVLVTSSEVTLNAGDGENTVTLKSLHTANLGSTLDVLAGAGKDTIEVEASGGIALNDSAVTLNAGDGDNTVALKSVTTTVHSSTLDVLAGAGNDAITIDAGPGSVAASAGAGTVTIDAGAGKDEITIEAGQYIALASGSKSSTVTVAGGDDSDHLVLDAGIALVHVENSGSASVTVDGGEGDDLIEVRGGNMNGGLLTGGTGADIFSFGGSEHEGHAVSGIMTITDFAIGDGGDKLLFKDLPLFRKNLGEYVKITADGDNSVKVDVYKEGNAGENGSPSFSVLLDGVLAGDVTLETVQTDLLSRAVITTPYDERFVVTRDTASKDFAGVLHNDGLDASITGVLDADGNVVTLEQLADMNGGAGLETGTGRLFMDGGTVAFQAKEGVSAEDSEIIVYVAEDKAGNEYTQAVQIRFTDDTNEFRSDEAVDTYYMQNTNAGDMADLYLGAGSDFVFVEGTQADGITRTVNVGDGDNTVTVKSANAIALTDSTLDVQAGAGNDTIALESNRIADSTRAPSPLTPVTATTPSL
jgi:hypothetical protein